MDRARGSHDDRKTSLRWGAIGVALAAVGATALFTRKQGGGAPTASSSESAEGRGQSVGPINAPSLEAGYEVEDTNVRLLVKIMVISIVLGIASLTGVFYMFARFNTHQRDARIGLTTEQSAAIAPPLPHLQAEPYRDINATIMEQQQRIETYGWDDSAHSQAHIPIVRAMQQVVGKSLDADAQSDQSTTPGTTVPMPELPAFSAAQPQNKPGHSVQGEGRPGAIAPSYDPGTTTEAKP